MKFELYGENKVHLTPGGYYNLNEDNPTELMIVKLALLQAHIETASDYVFETSEFPKNMPNSSEIKSLAESIFSKYQKDIESGNKKLFEQENLYTQNNFDYLYSDKPLEIVTLEIMRGSDYKTFEAAEKDGAVYSRDFVSMSEVENAIKGALLASDCINFNLTPRSPLP
jgi:hypothetical protein